MKRLKYVLFVVCWSIITSCSSGDNALIYTGVVEGTAIQIPSMTGGQIIELLIDTGQEVEQGQIICHGRYPGIIVPADNLNGILQEIASQNRVQLPIAPGPRRN